MTDNLPAVTRNELAGRARAGSPVNALRVALAGLDEQRVHLAEAGDWETLAIGLDALRAIQKDIGILIKSLTADVAELAPGKTAEIPGYGSLEIRHGKNRSKWDSEELLREVVKRALVDPDTGEVESDPAAVRERLLGTLSAVVPFTGSLGWRVTALRELGIDPDEWCQTDGYTTSVQIRHDDT